MTAPTAQWGDLIKSGYRVVYALQVDGIPYQFAAREMLTVEGVAPTVPSGFTMSYALIIREGMKISVEPDREKGIAAGRVVEFTLGRQQIADEGLGPPLFSRPTARATLTASVTEPVATTFNVDSTSDFGSTGSFYIGREYCTYGGKTSTSFTSVTRGVCGDPHYHTADARGAYRQCTNVPIYWRGRLVTLWAHLVSPEGRFLGDDWCTLGEFCRQDWRGYIRDTPRPNQDGITIACLPLVRIGAVEVGAELQGTLARDQFLGLPMIVTEASDTIFVANPTLSAVNIPTTPTGADYRIQAVATWAVQAHQSLNAVDADYLAQIYAAPEALYVILPEDEDTNPAFATGPAAYVRGQAWFLGDQPPSVSVVSRVSIDTDTQRVSYLHRIPYRWESSPGAYNRGAWIVVKIDPSEEFEDAVLAATGTLALEYNGHREIATYTETITNEDGTLIAFRIGSRHFGESWSLITQSGEGWDPWRNDTTVRVITGATGPWDVCLRTILTSSGTGDRGTYDLAAYGFGVGLPGSWIAAGDLGDVPQGNIMALTTGKTSVENLLCGWLALARMCLVQRRQADGAIVLDVISTDVADDTEAEQLTDADVLLDGHDTPEIIEAPNHIRIVASDAFNERPLYIVRDAARAQAEGVRSLELKAPGIGPERALELGGEMLLLGDGQAMTRLRLPPWVEVQSGDARELTTEHPSIWDWEAGEFGPSSVMGRVLTYERDLYTQHQEAEILLAGQSAGRTMLCPAALIIDVPGHSTTTLLHVAQGDSVGFRAGDEVLLYERTNEDSDTGTATIDAVVEGVTYDAGVTYYDTIEIDADPAVDGLEVMITYADYSSCVTRQQRHMFVRSDKEWR